MLLPFPSEPNHKTPPGLDEENKHAMRKLMQRVQRITTPTRQLERLEPTGPSCINRPSRAHTTRSTDRDRTSRALRATPCLRHIDRPRRHRARRRQRFLSRDRHGHHTLRGNDDLRRRGDRVTTLGIHGYDRSLRGRSRYRQCACQEGAGARQAG